MSIEAIQAGDKSQIIDIKLQDASSDIWDKKYRLKNKQGEPVDKNIDETYRRVARALSEVEDKGKRENWCSDNFHNLLGRFVIFTISKHLSHSCPRL